MRIKFNKDEVLFYIRKFWHKFIVLCSKLYAYLKMVTLTANPFLKKHKEDLFKVLLPLFIIALGFYSCSLKQKHITQNIAEIFNIADRIREYYLDKPDYWGLSTDFVIKERLIDEKFIKNGKIVLSSGVEIFVGEGEKAEILMPSSQDFDISIRHLNKASCLAYSEIKFPEEKLLEIVRITIINESEHHTFEWGGASPLPIQKYAAKNFCKDDNNTIIWSVK